MESRKLTYLLSVAVVAVVHVTPVVAVPVVCYKAPQSR
jgi:hypothetical protein